MKKISIFVPILFLLAACGSINANPNAAPASTDSPQANLPNPASVYCEQQGFRSEIRTADDGSQTGYCIFPDERECEEWAFYRGECGPGPTSTPEVATGPTEIPTAMPIDPADYLGWWTYTHPVYGFSIMLPEDWVVEEVTTGDPLMNHAINLHAREIAPGETAGSENIRMTFRLVGEETRLWPTGVGQGEFIPQGALEVAGQPARRILLVCPTGEVTSIWYHGSEESQPNIQRGDLEFGFIFSGPGHCELGYNLEGKTQRVGEMIIASLKVP